MEKEQDEKNSLTLMDAMAHFIGVVFPGLYVGDRFKNKHYQRIHSLIREYRKALKGERNLFTTTRAIGILNEYGGKVNNKPRYSFEVIVLAKIETPAQD